PGESAAAQDRGRSEGADHHQDRVGRRLQLRRGGARAMMLRRLVPHGLFGQMVLLLGAAIIVAKVGSWLVSEDERIYAVRRMHIEDTLARTASAVRLLAMTPPELHPYVLEAASSLDFRFKLVSGDEVPQTNITTEEAEIAR